FAYFCEPLRLLGLQLLRSLASPEKYLALLRRKALTVCFCTRSVYRVLGRFLRHLPEYLGVMLVAATTKAQEAATCCLLVEDCADRALVCQQRFKRCAVDGTCS